MSAVGPRCNAAVDDKHTCDVDKPYRHALDRLLTQNACHELGSIDAMAGVKHLHKAYAS